ncbi:MAG TPA: hypothetical protein VGM27_30120 [Acidobacteriaceae bacterium]|jgi:hypothetical protein
MRKNSVLVLLTAVGSAASWWPVFVEPTLYLPFWVGLACAALCAGLSTILTPALWRLLCIASGSGTYVGFSLGLMIWHSSDPLSAAWQPHFRVVFAPFVTLAVMLVAPVTRFLMRKRSISNRMIRQAAWAALLGCVAFGPTALALTPSIVKHRIGRNDRLAAERFLSLKKAVEGSRAEAEGESEVCDGLGLKRHYSGPPFSDADWGRITGNYVKQRGYFFMVYCRHEKDGYTIDAHPATPGEDGTRWFCAEGSGKVGCHMDQRHNCLPCPE